MFDCVFNLSFVCRVCSSCSIACSIFRLCAVFVLHESLHSSGGEALGSGSNWSVAPNGFLFPQSTQEYRCLV